ncbi:MAG: hypothetical protein LIP12_04080 [Clostridiales bacterium]|nr:hypothetical protein [Clostridiales bacterium]
MGLIVPYGCFFRRQRSPPPVSFQSISSAAFLPSQLSAQLIFSSRLRILCSGQSQKEGVRMAKSSIFANFTITDKETAEKFAEALEIASNQPKWTPSEPVEAPVRDPEKIRAIFARRAEKAKRQ